MIISYPEQFEAKVGYDRITRLSNYSIIRSPLYDLRTIMIDDSMLYDLIFDIIIGLMIIIVYVFVVLFVRYDIKKTRYNILIIKTLGLSDKKIKSQCILIRYLMMFISVISSIIIGYVIKNDIFFELRFKVTEYLGALFIVLLLYVIYVIQVYVGINRESHDRLTSIKQNHNY